MLRAWAIAGAAVFWSAAALAAGDGDAGEGRDLARRHCARCHVIKNYNPYGGTGNSPTFDRLVTWDNGIERIATFFERPPHPVFTRVEGVEPMDNVPATAAIFKLSLDDIDDLVAFAKALKRKRNSED